MGVLRFLVFLVRNFLALLSVFSFSKEFDGSVGKILVSLVVAMVQRLAEYGFGRVRFQRPKSASLLALTILGRELSAFFSACLLRAKAISPSFLFAELS